MIYTDYLGNSIWKGDYIVYPTATGSSAADMNFAVVEDVVPITPEKPEDPTCRRGSIPGDERKAHPPYRTIPGKWVKRPDLQNGYGDFLRDDSKAYQLRVRKLRDHDSGRAISNPSRIITLKNVDRVVVVTRIANVTV
jgi:hypothetical protein